MTNHNRKWLGRLFSWLAALACLFTLLPYMVAAAPAAQEKTSSLPKGDPVEAMDRQEICRNDRFVLYYTYETDLIEVEDLAAGMIWTSFPADGESDPVAEGSVAKELISNLTVTYCDDKNNNYNANSRTSAVNAMNHEAVALTHGLMVTYDFARRKEKFKIPVVYTLADTGLTATVLFDHIDEYADKKIVSVALMPYFGAGKANSNGFLLLPDGSGAVVNFADDRAWADSYEKSVYGSDPANSGYLFAKNEEQISLPVFGVAQQKGGFAAIISQGAEQANICAMQAGRSTGYANVYASFLYRRRDTKSLYDKFGTEKIITFEAKKPVDMNPMVSYLFTEKGTLADLAQVCRTQLTQTLGLKKQEINPALALTVYGASEKKASVLGFLVDQVVPATTVSQLNQIMQPLWDGGVGAVDLQLAYFNKKGTGSRAQGAFSLERALGTTGELKAFLKKASKYHTQVYAGINLLWAKRQSFGWWEFNSAATNLNQTHLVEDVYKPGIRSVDTTQQLYFYLRPTRLQELATEDAMAKTKALGFAGVRYTGMGTTLYSDNKAACLSNRRQTAEVYRNVLNTTAKGGLAYWSDGGNLYAAAAAKQVSDLPLNSSSFDIMTKAVPFYEMVFHGYLALSGEAVNCDASPQINLLRCLMTGTTPQYALTYESPVVFKDTSLNTLLSTRASDWKEDILQGWKQYKEVQDGLSGQLLTDFGWEGRLEWCVYENGTTVVINTGKTDAVYQGKTIKALQYTIIPGAAQQA